jgi:DNA-binding HxlR family transcriptional regulator
MQATNAYAATCPTRLVLDRVADKWAVLLLGLLAQRPVRFNQLRREIEGISQKVLSQTLKSLERDGLVKRTATATVPVTVEYSITPLGRTLADTVDALRVWAETHMREVLAAQRKYDAPAPAARAASGVRVVRRVSAAAKAAQ